MSRAVATGAGQRGHEREDGDAPGASHSWCSRSPAPEREGTPLAFPPSQSTYLTDALDHCVSPDMCG